jgi:hypothetical protein
MKDEQNKRFDRENITVNVPIEMRVIRRLFFTFFESVLSLFIIPNFWLVSGKLAMTNLYLFIAR